MSVDICAYRGRRESVAPAFFEPLQRGRLRGLDAPGWSAGREAGEDKIKGLSRDARQVIVCTSFLRERGRRGARLIVYLALCDVPFAVPR